ncbi:hypothetical protein [Paenibacillus chitinolyticus]|uniref:hypothetical protein n=1 Tax=Paenibacillus chitinolyticus TaxID=79263 RepID=UPI0036668B0C
MNFKVGDKVKHAEHGFYGNGEVIGLSKTGKSATVKWPNAFGTWIINTYRIQSLTKVEESNVTT